MGISQRPKRNNYSKPNNKNLTPISNKHIPINIYKFFRNRQNTFPILQIKTFAGAFDVKNLANFKNRGKIIRNKGLDGVGV